MPEMVARSNISRAFLASVIAGLHGKGLHYTYMCTCVI